MSAFLLPNADRGQEPNRVRHGRLVYNIPRCPFIQSIKGEVRSKIKLSVFGALIRMVLVRGASEQPFLRYSNFKDNQIWESLFMSR